MIDVKGRWALVTGGTRGIGRLAALFLAKRGCNLVIQCRDAGKAAPIIRELEDLGVEAYAVSAELSQTDQVEKMLAMIDAKGTPIDIVLNNAGMQIAYRTDYYQTPVNDFTESFLVNTIAPTLICYHFLPKMIEHGFGRIVNTTSGIDKEPEQAGYSASKAALDKLTTDLGSKIDGTDVMINLTDPGWCRTDLGGPNAFHAPESALPGVVLGVFLDDKKSGRLFSAQNYKDMSLEDAIKIIESSRKI